MTKIIPTGIGGYPRPDWFKDYLKGLGGLQKGGKGEIGKAEYRKALTEILNEQKNSGIKLFTDGQLAWQDFLCHLCTRMDGFEMTGLIRYFDNNVYYRMPKVISRLKAKNPLILDEFKIAHEIQPESKAVLSCFTLAELSKNEFYKNKKEFVMELAGIMNQEAKKLADAGAGYIQIDEPSLLYASKDDLKIAKEAVDTIKKGVKAKFFLATYFRSAESIFPEILDFDIDVIGLDFVEGYDKNLELLKEYKPEKEILAGVVDGRNTKIENPKDVKRKVEGIKSLTNAEILYVSPNTGLEFLPYIKASEKLRQCAIR